MHSFLTALKVQRWDDHRFYHQSLVNQTLHFVSALGFLCSYALLLKDPALAALIAWLWSMITRQSGHFFFEPRGYDKVNEATEEYKEEVKVGYNLHRKRILMALWALSPLALMVDPTLFGAFPAAATNFELLRHVGYIWFAVGVGGIIFRMIQLTVQQDAQTALVWLTKILTDPIHDVQIYYKSPFQLAGKLFASKDLALPAEEEEEEIEDEPATAH